MNPCKDFHQGGFTRAIFTDEGDYFATRDIEAHGIERGHAWEAFRYSRHLERVLHRFRLQSRETQLPS
jgi:hypothetical protein